MIEIENSSFSRFLAEHKRHRFTVVTLPGNNGDVLIQKGLYKKMNELGITFSVVEIEKNPLYYLKRFFYSKFGINGYTPVKPDCDFVLLQGGGYMNDYGGVCEGCRILEALSIYDKPIVVAPQTFYFKSLDFSKFLSKMKNKIHLFCRERVSFDSLKKMGLSENVSISLAHDTAFYLDEFVRRNNGYDLVSFRSDGEARLLFSEKKLLMRHLIDSDRKIYTEDVSKCATYQDFVELIESADRIFTDRLHVAILGSILNKKTILFPNIYFKNKAVYDYSLEGYPETHFCDSVEDCMKLVA